jgi:hypothetical protein
MPTQDNTMEVEVRFAIAIIDNCIQISTYKYCVHCLSNDHDENDNIVHEDGCIVIEAKEFWEEHRPYDPEFGDDRVCECGHSYYRHFDSYEHMEPIGCKYCSCYKFKEAPTR